MKIELKNVKVNLTFSEETTMFSADVFVDGVKTAYAKNDGRGGCTDYHAYEHKRALLQHAEAYAKSLPSEDHKFGDTTITIESNLEFLIDKLVDEFVTKKENIRLEKKIQKTCETKIVWGYPNYDGVQGWGWKTTTIESMNKTPQGKLAIAELLKKVRKEMKEGQIIFNKNITL